MSTSVSRLRMFAGPNGSGKSTINALIRPESCWGFTLILNDIEKAIRERGDFLDLASYGVNTTRKEILGFFSTVHFVGKS